ncbi:class E sortase [Streptomyces lavendulocolor]
MTAVRPEHEHGSPWFRASNQPESQGPDPGAAPYAAGGPGAAHGPGPGQPGPEYDPYAGTWAPGTGPVPDDETMALRTEATRRIVAEPATSPYEPVPGPSGAAQGSTPGPAPERPTGGRAERRRAAKGRGRRRKGASSPAPAPPPSPDPGRPLTRVEARRAARARKDSVGVVASRVVGELFITFGVVMLLFVTYQLWWTNIRAGFQADEAKQGIENAWAEGRKPDAFQPGQGFAIMYIPKLDVVVPIAEGIDKKRVLDRGMVGHYAEGQLKTAMPSDRRGNFAVAGHRNTHGEPFRYINRLTPGDPIVVETQDSYYTYEMTSILPQTPPSNVSVIQPVPAGSGFTGPGRYITLTTCTPEFTSTYRMIVWGKMVDERPRSKGKPDALVG